MFKVHGQRSQAHARLLGPPFLPLRGQNGTERSEMSGQRFPWSSQPDSVNRPPRTGWCTRDKDRKEKKKIPLLLKVGLVHAKSQKRFLVIKNKKENKLEEVQGTQEGCVNHAMLLLPFRHSIRIRMERSQGLPKPKLSAGRSRLYPFPSRKRSLQLLCPNN